MYFFYERAPDLSGRLPAVLGRRRDPQKNLLKADSYALGARLLFALVAALFWSAPALAQAPNKAESGEGQTARAAKGRAAEPAPGPNPHVQNRCPRLNGRAYDELDARVQLLLKSENESTARSLPGVVCEGKAAWVEWDGQRFDIVGRAPLVDEVVDIIEAQLHDAQRKNDADLKTQEDAAVAAGQPMLQRGTGAPPPPPSTTQAADRMAVRGEAARGGGISLGIEVEAPSHKGISVASGPVFDLGASVGPLILGGREAIRFSLSGRSVSFMDFQGAIGIGAPFDPGSRFGAVVRFGAEWMVAYPEGNSSQAVVTPVVDVGLRVAQPLGRFSLWLGVDGHGRLGELKLMSRSTVRANNVGVSLTLGCAFVDWSRK